MARSKHQPVKPGKDDPLDAPAERENKEYDRPPHDPYRGIPKDAPRSWYQVFNLEVPGEQIEICVNGFTTTIQHGESVNLHKSQVEAIKNAVIHTTEYREVQKGQLMYREEIPVTRPRLSLLPVNGPQPAPKRTNQIGVDANHDAPIVNKQMPTGSLLEGRAGQEPKVISGRGEE
jgi:hypothetical protein